MEEKGILLIATKHPYYGRMAYNLAVTIKAVQPDARVAILHSGRGLSHLSERQKEVFHSLIELPDGDALGIGAKVYVYDYSPFEKTLVIDSDNLWLPVKRPAELFEELKGIKFTAITEGRYNIESRESELNTFYFLWADPLEIIQTYKLVKGWIYQWRSEVMYFERHGLIEAMFHSAKEVFHNPRVKVGEFAGVVPDELCLNIACAKHGIEPHKYKWTPCYWDRVDQASRRLPLSQLYQKYFLMSTGGNRSSKHATDLYNKVAGASFHKLGLQHLFTLQSKKHAITERQTI